MKNLNSLKYQKINFNTHTLHLLICKSKMILLINNSSIFFYSFQICFLAVLKGGENPRLPGASTLLDVEETVNAGKRVIAAKNIEPGDRLIIESPHAAILLPEFFGTHCQHCFSRLVLYPSKSPFFRTKIGVSCKLENIGKFE